MVTDLQKRVIKARRKQAARLKANYVLARSYGYMSEEAGIIMNQSYKTIIARAIQDNRNYSHQEEQTLPDHYLALVHLQETAQDVTNEGGE